MFLWYIKIWFVFVYKKNDLNVYFLKIFSYFVLSDKYFCVTCAWQVPVAQHIGYIDHNLRSLFQVQDLAGT